MLVDTEACFRAFKAGVDYAAEAESKDIFERLVSAYEQQAEAEG